MLKKGFRVPPEMSRKKQEREEPKMDQFIRCSDIPKRKISRHCKYLKKKKHLIRNENFVGREQLGIEKFDEVKTFNFF